MRGLWRRLVDRINRADRARAALARAAEHQQAEQQKARESVIALAHPPVDDTTQIVPQVTTLLTYGQQHGYQADHR